MWAEDAPDGNVLPIRVPFSLQAALGLTVFATLAFGVWPALVNTVSDVTLLVGG